MPLTPIATVMTHSLKDIQPLLTLQVREKLDRFRTQRLKVWGISTQVFWSDRRQVVEAFQAL